MSSVGSSFPQNTPKHSWVMQCVSGTTLNASRRTLWRIVQRIRRRRLLLKKTDCFDDGSRWSQGTYITRDYRDYCDGHVQKDVELPVKHSFGAPCSLGTEGHPLRFSHAKQAALLCTLFISCALAFLSPTTLLEQLRSGGSRAG